MLTKEQLVERKKGIGGSDAAAICGVSKYKTPVSVYLNKISPIEEQSSGLEKISDVLARGNELEELIRKKFSSMIGYEVLPVKKTIYHKTYPFMLANIDGYIKEVKAVVEIKTARLSMRSEWGDSFTDQIPKEYLTQAHHYMNVCEVAKAYVVVCFASEETFSLIRIMLKNMKLEDVLKEEIPLDIRIFEVERSPSFDKVLINVERRFWLEHVEKRVAPAWTNIDDLKELFPLSLEGKKVIASENDVVLLKEIKVCNSAIKEQEEKLKSLQGKIIERIKDAEEMIDQDGNPLVTFKSCLTNRFDTITFKKEYSDLYTQFLKQSQSRRFLVKGENND